MEVAVINSRLEWMHQKRIGPALVAEVLKSRE
jgi:hypothetical protein